MHPIAVLSSLLFLLVPVESQTPRSCTDTDANGKVDFQAYNFKTSRWQGVTWFCNNYLEGGNWTLVGQSGNGSQIARLGLDVPFGWNNAALSVDVLSNNDTNSFYSSGAAQFIGNVSNSSVLALGIDQLLIIGNVSSDPFHPVGATSSVYLLTFYEPRFKLPVSGDPDLIRYTDYDIEVLGTHGDLDTTFFNYIYWTDSNAFVFRDVPSRGSSAANSWGLRYDLWDLVGVPGQAGLQMLKVALYARFTPTLTTSAPTTSMLTTPTLVTSTLTSSSMSTQPTQNSQSSVKSEGSSVGISERPPAWIAAPIVIGVFVIIFIVSIIAFVILWRRRRLHSQVEINLKVKENLFLEGITIKEEIGKGAFGIVFKGLWDETPVALKRVGLDVCDDDFAKEAEMLRSLSHPNVIPFRGLCVIDGIQYIVVDFASDGNLIAYLKMHPPPPNVILNMLLDVSKGMTYIHKNGIVHRDLAARNLLVDGQRILVSDLGMSRNVDRASLAYTASSTTIPIRWSAPEVIQQHPFSMASDVYSFGVVCWEIYNNGMLPYAWMSNAEVAQAVVNGEGLPRPKDCPDSMWNLMSECWAVSPSDRPDFLQITRRVAEMVGKDQVIMTVEEPNPILPDVLYANQSWGNYEN